MHFRLHLCVFAAALGTSVPAQAAPAEEAAGKTTADPLAEAKRLHSQGAAQYDMSDYDGAIDSWTQAYQLVVEAGGDPGIRAALVYNVSRAQRDAYEIDRDPARLRKAVELLERSIEFETQFDSPDPANVKQLEEELEVVKAAVSEHEASEAAAEVEPPIAAPVVESDSQSESDRKPNALMYAGIGTLVLGVAGGGVAAAGMVLGSQAQDELTQHPDDPDARAAVAKRGENANLMTYVGASVGAVGLVAGTVLLVVGAKRRSQGETARSSLQPGVAWSPGGASLSLRGRF